MHLNNFLSESMYLLYDREEVYTFSLAKFGRDKIFGLSALRGSPSEIEQAEAARFCSGK